MSLRTNLSTRPFYNERAVQTVIAVFGALVLIATLFNVWQLVALTTQDRSRSAEAVEAERRTRELQQETARARSSIDRERVAAVAEAAREANAVIRGRTFSWTALFNRIESTLPPDVRIVSVQPRVDEGGQLTVGIVVEAMSIADIDAFIVALEDTGAFENLLARTEQETEDGLIEARLEGRYHQVRAEAPAGGTDEGAAR
ncbi:MAG TPA: hypothetical protein VF198_07680 [Vicinamibacterales bacterium]